MGPPTSETIAEYDYFARDRATGAEFPVEVETAGGGSESDLVWNLRNQIRDLQGRLASPPAAAPAPPDKSTSVPSEARQRELLAGRPAALKVFEAGRAAPAPVKVKGMTSEQIHKHLAGRAGGAAALAMLAADGSST